MTVVAVQNVKKFLKLSLQELVSQQVKLFSLEEKKPKVSSIHDKTVQDIPLPVGKIFLLKMPLIRKENLKVNQIIPRFKEGQWLHEGR